jgi:sugar phosphate isomerase/epimerase
MAIVTDIAQYAKEKKVRVGIENMEKRPYELVFTIDDLNRFAHLTENNPYFGATIDFAHYSSHNIGLPNLDELKLPLYNVHLSQNSAGGKMHHSLVCDNGLVNLVEVCRSLENYGYDKLVVLEVGGIVLESKQTLEAALKELEA